MIAMRGFLAAAFLFVVGAAVCLPLHQAHALANGNLNVSSGSSLAEVELVLTDEAGQVVKEDEDSEKGAGYWRYRNLRAGTYTLKILRNGVQVGQPRRIELPDGKTTTFRVNADSGQVQTASSVHGPEMMPRYSVGVVGGIKDTPWDGAISSSAGNFLDSGGLDESLGVIGVEGRLYLSPTQQRMQALGAGLFLAGTFLHYTSGGLDRLFGDRHPTRGNDVGAGIDERWSLLLGLGKEFNLWQRAGLALMIGAHMTRADVALLFDESGGGGSNQRISDRETLFGAFIGLELFYTLGYLSGYPFQLMVQSHIMSMPSTTLNARSMDTNWDYHVKVEGGAQYDVLGGLRVLF